LERCVASRRTQNNTDLAVTPGDTMSGRGIWSYHFIQLLFLKAQLVLAVSLVEDLPFFRVR
jgi:NO-binding membrane sensor protein with MHYT domain